MAMVEIKSQVGPDGMLLLAIPVGAENANRQVKVTVAALEEAPAPPKMTQREREEFIDRTAGSIDDPTFVRPPQGELEERGELFP
jgi:hypothetical protein